MTDATEPEAIERTTHKSGKEMVTCSRCGYIMTETLVKWQEYETPEREFALCEYCQEKFDAWLDRNHLSSFLKGW